MKKVIKNKEEKIEEPIIEKVEKTIEEPKESKTRECSCGEEVRLPNSSEEFTMCKECGIKHIR